MTPLRGPSSRPGPSTPTASAGRRGALGLVVAAAVAFAAPAGLARADETSAVTPAVVGTVEAVPPLDAIGTWVATLGSPTSEHPLDRLPDLPRALSSEDALRAVSALKMAGGCEATDALRAFLGHRCAEVRVAAADAIGAVGIRLRGTVNDLRSATTAREPEVRLAAYEALGRVGDARDVPGLLDRLGSPETEVRATALRSLRGITGVRIVGSVQRWDRWWRLSCSTLPRRLHAALTAVTNGTDDPVAARETVVRYAWIDVDAVEDAARGWLHSGDLRLRTEGARVTAALRLGGLADDVRSVQRYTNDSGLFTLAAEAAQAVGAPVTDLRMPVAARK